MPILTIFYISLAFLLLYDCSAYSYNSYNSYNSYYFNSNFFNSGSKHFNSNFFNSDTIAYSNNFASNPFKYISFINSNFVSSNSHIYSILSSSFTPNAIVSSKSKSNSNYICSNPYLTFINSYSIIQSQQKSYLSSALTYITNIPTILPTAAPTLLMPTLEPTYITENPTITPTVAPTSLMPTSEPPYITENPTITPTVAPTSLMPIISFTTDLTLSNVQTNYLDDLAQQSVVIATANSMNISVDFVTFVSSSVLQNRKMSSIELLSFNLLATTKTSIPLVGKYSVFTSDPMSLFTTLSNTMTTAVANGAFTNYLVTASLQLNSTTTSSASVSGITIVQINTTTTIISPTSSPTILNQHDVTGPYYQTNYYYILLYIFGSFVSFWLLVYIVIVFYKRKRRRLAKYIMNLPSTVRRLGAHSIQQSIEQPNTIQNDSNNDIKNTEDIVLIIDN